MVGMRDVAKQAGVSLSTVSLVVNGTGYVSDDMRDRVQRAMESLHYVPNDLARNFSQNRANTIGIIVPTIRHPFLPRLPQACSMYWRGRDCRRCCVPPPTRRMAKRHTSICFADD